MNNKIKKQKIRILILKTKIKILKILKIIMFKINLNQNNKFKNLIEIKKLIKKMRKIKRINKQIRIRIMILMIIKYK